MNGNTIPVCSTPVTDSKKRELSSPLDYTDLKKSKMAESKMESQIVLSSEDITAIAGVLKDTFQSEMLTPRPATNIDATIQAIVDGVLAGLNQKIQKLEKENEELRTRVCKLERDADTAEQYSRRNCLRISGIPETVTGRDGDMSSQNKAMLPKHEFTDEKVRKIARALEVNVDLTDIDRSHRIGIQKPGKPRDIIVKFSTYRARNALYRARVGLKTCGYSGVFVNEDLTQIRSALFYKARQLVKDRYLNGAWTYDGTIMVKDDNQKTHRITCVSELVSAKCSQPIQR